jgi:hypothetical protein
MLNLRRLIPELFPDHKIKALSTSEIFLNNLIAGFMPSFWTGLVQRPHNASVGKFSRPRRPNKALETLRKRKLELKKVRKALLKAGLENTVEGVRISKEWFQLSQTAQ